MAPCLEPCFSGNLKPETIMIAALLRPFFVRHVSQNHDKRRATGSVFMGHSSCDACSRHHDK
ncbi:hypothetical protein COCNU_scaffold029857G000010 [Cocos nucifera]|nr:hypothetical protein [Cocos nucifera]